MKASDGQTVIGGLGRKGERRDDVNTTTATAA